MITTFTAAWALKGYWYYFESCRHSGLKLSFEHVTAFYICITIESCRYTYSVSLPYPAKRLGSYTGISWVRVINKVTFKLLLLDIKKKKDTRERLTLKYAFPERCGSSTLSNFQNWAEQSPEQPDLTLKLSLLWVEGWTSWPPNAPSSVSCSAFSISWAASGVWKKYRSGKERSHPQKFLGI